LHKALLAHLFQPTKDNARQNTILTVRLFINSYKILKFCPRFHLNRRGKSLSLCLAMDTLEGNILSDQMDISDDDQMDWQVVEPLARGMTNLQIESCLKGYPATVCCADELPLHVRVKPHTFIVNTDTSDRGWGHWVVFHFPLVGPVNHTSSGDDARWVVLAVV
jgi:hypothetical protein